MGAKCRKEEKRLYRDANREILRSKSRAYQQTEDGWLLYILKDMKKRASKKDLEVNVDREYLRSLLVTECPYTGLRLVRNKGKQGPDSISFDRIDNSKGYVKGNIQCVSLSYNAKKWTN